MRAGQDGVAKPALPVKASLDPPTQLNAFQTPDYAASGYIRATTLPHSQGKPCTPTVHVARMQRNTGFRATTTPDYAAKRLHPGYRLEGIAGMSGLSDGFIQVYRILRQRCWLFAIARGRILRL